MATIEEIRVRAKRLKGPSLIGSSLGFRVNTFGGGFVSDEEADRREDRDEEDAEKEAEKKKPEIIEEIVAVGTATATKGRIPAGMTRTEFNLGRERAASLNRAFNAMNRKAVTDKLTKPPKKIPEIVVKAKRLPKTFGRFLRFGGPVTFGADIVARIVDQMSRQRLDEAGRVATRTVRPGPDTKVKTIKPEKIPEIVVKAKRPKPKTPTDPRFLVTNLRELGVPNVGFPNQRPTAGVPRIAVPKAPRKKAPKTVKPLLLTGTNPLPRSIQLGIPRRVPGQPSVRTTPGGGVLTGFNTTVLPLAQGQPVRSSRCPPCRPKRKKNRTKCYKKLVKERTNPRNDKFYKLVEINCRTGKEISKKRKR